MDPVSLLIGAMVLAGVVTNTVTTGRSEYQLTKQGIVPPRMAHKYRDKPPRKYGLRDHVADLWSDGWRRRTSPHRPYQG